MRQLTQDWRFDILEMAPLSCLQILTQLRTSLHLFMLPKIASQSGDGTVQDVQGRADHLGIPCVGSTDGASRGASDRSAAARMAS